MTRLLLATITGAFLGYALAVLAAEAELRREVEQMDAETVELRTRPLRWNDTGDVVEFYHVMAQGRLN